MAKNGENRDNGDTTALNDMPRGLHLSLACSFSLWPVALFEAQFPRAELCLMVTLWLLFLCPFKMLDRTVTEGAWHLEAVAGTI